MNKKDLKWYETPAMEVVNLKLEGFLCASAPEDVKDEQVIDLDQ